MTKKRKEEIQRIDYPEDVDDNEEGYETEDSGEESEGEEPDESELPEMPQPVQPIRRAAGRPVGRPVQKVQQKKKDEVLEEPGTAQNYSASEYFDIIEGNIRRAYLAMDELRKLTKM